MSEKDLLQKYRFWDRLGSLSSLLNLAFLFLFIALAVYNVDQNMKLEAALKACQAGEKTAKENANNKGSPDERTDDKPHSR